MNFLKNISKICLLIALFFVASSNVYAAGLYIDPSSSNLNVGDTFTANIYVNSQGEAINNVEGVINVSDSLELLNVSTSGSVLNLWVEQPSISGKKVSFNGGVTNPGYTGSSGKVVSLSLRASAAGSASISFSSGSVRLNDGLGTDVLNSKSGANITISSPVISEPTTPSVESESGASAETTKKNAVSSASGEKALVINSDSAPDSDKWYKTKSTTFSWALPSGATAIKTLFDKNKNSDPTILYENTFSTKTLNDLDDGVWYFHLKYQTSNGWSEVAHKKIQIDNSLPSIELFDYKILENNLVKLIVDSTDDVSDISKINIKVDDSIEKEISSFESNGEIEYIFSEDNYGLKNVEIIAFDQAGNSSSENLEIDFPKVERPIIAEYTAVIEDSESIKVSGSSSYINSDIEIYVENDNGDVESFKTKTDGSGNFTYVVDQLKISKTSTLTMWAQIVFEEENYIISSEKKEIDFKGKSLTDLAKEFNQRLIVFMPSIIIFFIIVWLAYFVSKKISGRREYWDRRRKIALIRKEALSLLDAFKDNVEDSVKQAKQQLDTKDIREIENEILNNLLESFAVAQKIVYSKIKKPKRVYKKKRVDSDII